MTIYYNTNTTGLDVKRTPKPTLTSKEARNILLGEEHNKHNHERSELLYFITESKDASVILRKCKGFNPEIRKHLVSQITDSGDARDVLLVQKNLARTQSNRNHLVSQITKSWDARKVLINAPNLSNANRNYLVSQITESEDAGWVLGYACCLTEANERYLKMVKLKNKLCEMESLMTEYKKKLIEIIGV